MYKRKHIRFQPEDGTLAILSVPAKPDVTSLVITESQGGCSLCLLRDLDLIVGDRFKIKVGQLAPILAEVAWVKHLETEITKIGVKFLD